jgi:hypothetical protein
MENPFDIIQQKLDKIIHGGIKTKTYSQQSLSFPVTSAPSINIT